MDGDLKNSYKKVKMVRFVYGELVRQRIIFGVSITEISVILNIATSVAEVELVREYLTRIIVNSRENSINSEEDPSKLVNYILKEIISNDCLESKRKMLISSLKLDIKESFQINYSNLNFYLGKEIKNAEDE